MKHLVKHIRHSELCDQLPRSFERLYFHELSIYAKGRNIAVMR